MPQANPIGPPPTIIMGKCDEDISKYKEDETVRLKTKNH
jgi:hypothetical protein